MFKPMSNPKDHASLLQGFYEFQQQAMQRNITSDELDQLFYVLDPGTNNYDLKYAFEAMARQCWDHEEVMFKPMSNPKDHASLLQGVYEFQKEAMQRNITSDEIDQLFYVLDPGANNYDLKYAFWAMARQCWDHAEKERAKLHPVPPTVEPTDPILITDVTTDGGEVA